jgi:nucleoid DNA-binding protein
MARKAAKKAPAKKAKAPARKTAPKAKKAAAPPPRKIRVMVEPGKTVTASALLQVFADEAAMKKAEAKRLAELYIDVVKAHVLKGGKVKLGDIGMIMIRARKARMGRNPQTGEPVKIKASKKLAFRQSATMRDIVRGG